MSRSRLLAASLSSLVVVACSGGSTRTTETHPTIGSAPAPADGEIAFPSRPPRTYSRGDHATPVIDVVGPFSLAAMSPDGLLVALTSRGSDAVHFMDVDRGRIVGGATIVGVDGASRLHWGADDALFAEGIGRIDQLDGTTGRAVASFANAHPDVVRRANGWAAVIGEESKKVALVDLSNPSKAIVSLPPDYVEETADLGGSAFAVATGKETTVYEGDGTTRWTHQTPFGPRLDRMSALGEPASVVRFQHGHESVFLSARDGMPIGVAADGVAHALGAFSLAGERVRKQSWADASVEDVGVVPGGDASQRLVGVSPHGTTFAYESQGKLSFADRRGTLVAKVDVGGTPVFGADDLPRGVIRADAIYAIQRGRATKLATIGSAGAQRIVSAGGTGFAARCEGGAIATLGANVVAPRSLTADPGSVDAITTADGAYRVTWGEKLVITNTKDGTATELALAPIASVKPHPNGRTAIVASHRMYVGHGWVADPAAAVVFVDIPTGKVTKKIPGDEGEITPDGKRLFVASHADVVLYDAETFRKLRRWPGEGNDVKLDPTNRFAIVFNRAKVSMGPLETRASFVEDVGTGRRVVDLEAHEGTFAFDPSGREVAFVPGNGYPDYGDAMKVEVHDLLHPAKPRVIQTDAPIESIQYLAGGRVLAVSLHDRIVLHRMRDGREVTVHAVPEDAACRLFAVDASGHFTGDPGSRLGLRFGEDLRKSEIVSSGPAFEALRDARLIDDLFSQ